MADLTRCGCATGGTSRVTLEARCAVCGGRSGAAAADGEAELLVAFSAAVALLREAQAAFGTAAGATGTPAELSATATRLEKLLLDAARGACQPLLVSTEQREARRKRAAQRRMVLDELVATEEDYVRDLNTLNTVWRPGMEAAGLLAPQGSATLFGTIPQLEFLAGELLREMRAVRERPLAEQRLGEVLLKKLPFLRLYIEHCSEHSRGMALLKELCADQRFLDFQDRVMREREAVRHIDLAGFLIKPTQRITRYPLLIRDLIKLTEKDHPDFDKLLQMEVKLRGILDEINEKTRLQESVDLFLSVQPVLRWTNRAYDLVASRSIVYCHGKIRWELICPSISPEPLARGNYVFVINHFVLACNERTGQYVELATFLIQKIVLAEQDSTVHDVMLNINRGDGASETFIVHANDFLDYQSWYTAIKTCRDNAPAQPAQLTEMPSNRRQTTDGAMGQAQWVIPPLRLQSARSEGTSSPPGDDSHFHTARESYLTMRTSRTSSSLQRGKTVMTFKDDTALHSLPVHSDASVHRPKAHHARTHSQLTLDPSALGSTPPLQPTEPAEVPPESADTPPADTSKKHKKHKKSSKLKVKEPHSATMTRQRSNDVVLVLPPQAATVTTQSLASPPSPASAPTSTSPSPSSPTPLAAVTTAKSPSSLTLAPASGTS